MGGMAWHGQARAMQTKFGFRPEDPLLASENPTRFRKLFGAAGQSHMSHMGDVWDASLLCRLVMIGEVLPHAE